MNNDPPTCFGIHRESPDGHWIWEAEFGGQRFRGSVCSYDTALARIDDLAREYRTARLNLPPPPYTTTSLHPLIKWSPRLLFVWILASSGPVVPISILAVALLAALQFQATPLAIAIFMMAIVRCAIGMLAWLARAEWTTHWRKQVSRFPCWPWFEPVPPGNPRDAPPMPHVIGSPSSLARVNFEEPVWRFLKEAQVLARDEGLNANHPILHKLRALAAERHFEQSEERWIRDRLDNMRLVDKFVRRTYLDSQKDHALPVPDYIESPEDFLRESARLNRWNTVVHWFSYKLAWLSWVAVPALVFVVTSRLGHGPARDHIHIFANALVAGISLPILAWWLKAKNVELHDRWIDLRQRASEAILLASPEDRKNWPQTARSEFGHYSIST
jgi:hypothetical protein